MRIVPVDAATRPTVRAFLEAHLDTSVFLLSSMEHHGSRLTDSPNSGVVECVHDGHTCIGAFLLTRRGHLLAQTAGRRDLAAPILEACGATGRRVTGIVAEWNAAESLRHALMATGSFRPLYEWRTNVYSLAAPDAQPGPSTRALRMDSAAGVEIRVLDESDFGDWDALHHDFLATQAYDLPMTLPERRAWFLNRAALGYWWGAFAARDLVAIVAIDDIYGRVAQIGSLYTAPQWRRRGLARRLLGSPFGRTRHVPLDRLLVCVKEENEAARRAYESIGGALAGQFGFILE